MAVQDGYGKVSGSNSLVFAYDLKDTTNSFKGQPATNIFLSGNPNGQGSAVEIIQTNYFLGKVIDSGTVYRSYVINPAQSDTGTYYNNGGINMGSMVFPQLNPNTKYIQISFDYYGITPYVRYCCSGTGLNGYLGVTSTDSTYDTYGWDTTYSPGSGDDWNNDINRMGYWQKISLIVDLRDDKTPSNISSMYIYMDAATQGDGYFTNMTFTEHTTYPSGPVRWVSGTRSNTQGLLDLTGNSNVNISGVSFNSNAVITFDGTNDKIDIVPPNTVNVNTGTTIVAVIRKTSTGYTGQKNIISYRNGTTGGNLYIGSGSGAIFSYYDTLNVPYHTVGTIPDNQYVHIVVRINNNGSISHFSNGSLAGTTPVRTGFNPDPNNKITIGNDASTNEFFQGDIAVFKHYNTQLSDTEILNDYLKYKRQYGLT